MKCSVSVLSLALVAFIGLSSFLLVAGEHSLVGWDDVHSFAYNKKTFPGGVFDKEGHSLITEKQSSSALFVWDLNGVILKVDSFFTKVKKMISICRQRGIWFTLVLLRDYYQVNSYMECQKENSKDSDKYVTCWPCAYQVIAQKNYPHNQEKRDACVASLEWLYPQVNDLNKKVAIIVQQLDQEGFKNAICTNLSIVSLLEQAFVFERNERQISDEKQKKQYQWMTAFFRRNTHYAPSLADDWFFKPNPEPYRIVLIKNPGYALRVFVDDEKKNIGAAIENGFDIAFYFKNAEQFLYEIKEMGFLNYQSSKMEDYSLIGLN